MVRFGREIIYISILLNYITYSNSSGLGKKISRKRDSSCENKVKLLTVQDNKCLGSKKGRARKVTEKYLGKITPHGIVKAKQKRIIEGLNNITAKEFGASKFINSIDSNIIELLKENYPAQFE